MKRFWLFLESYVFVWTNHEAVLLYDSLSGKGVTWKLTDPVRTIVMELMKKENLYCMELTENDLNVPEVADFVSEIRRNFIGDLYSQEEFRQKPLVIVPEVSVNENLENDVETMNNLELFGQKIVNNLRVVTMRLTGECSINCRYCQTVDKQIVWCRKQDNRLSYNEICRLLEQLKHTPVTLINFVGGNVLSYPFLDELLNELKKYSFGKCFYLYYKQSVDYEQIRAKLLNDPSVSIKFLIDYPVNEYAISACVALPNERVEYCFAVTSEEEFQEVSRIIDVYKLKANIYPFYTIDNLDFFEKYVFQTLEDVMALCRTKKDIFAHQLVNTHFFGTLYIDCDGKVYPNFNSKSIGTIDGYVKDWVFQEMKQGKMWHWTRDSLPACKECLYKYLCPSPSNYELVIGKPNLCHVKPWKC